MLNGILAGILAYTGYELTNENNNDSNDKPVKMTPPIKKNNIFSNVYDTNISEELQAQLDNAKRKRHLESQKPSVSGIIPENVNTFAKDEFGDLIDTSKPANKISNQNKKPSSEGFNMFDQSAFAPKTLDRVKQDLNKMHFNNGENKEEKTSTRELNKQSANYFDKKDNKNNKDSKKSNNFEPFQIHYNDRIMPKSSNNNNIENSNRNKTSNNIKKVQITTNQEVDFLNLDKEFRDANAKRARLIYDENENNGSSWTDLFDEQVMDVDGKPVPDNAVADFNNKTKRVDMERDLAAKDSWTPFNRNKNMTYNVENDTEGFTHNNMVPMYREKFGYGDYTHGQDSIKTQKLELFTGVNQLKQQYPKTENGPRFAPQMNVNNVFGTPSMDYQLDRYSTMLSDTRNGELLADPIRVNPGLDLDYDEQGNDGFHPIWRDLPKTSNQMRNANKQRIDNGNMINHGQRGAKRGIQADVSKNKPYRYFEQSPDDLIANDAAVKGPRVNENYKLDPTRRDYSNVSYTGAPHTSYGDVGMAKPEYMFPKYKVSDKTTYGNAGLRNVNNKNKSQQVGNYYNTNTIRSQTSNTFQGGHVQGEVRNYTIDPKDVPKVTTKESTLFDNGLYTQLVGDRKEGMAPLTDKMKTTTKETTERKLHSGVIGQLNGKSRAYDPTDVPRTTTAETTLFNPGEFGKISGVVSKNRAFDPKDKMRTTMKELFEVAERGGNVEGSNKRGGYESAKYDAKTTVREQTGNKDRAGNVEGSNKRGGYESAKYRAKTTIREQTEKKDRAGNVEGSNKRGGYESAKYRAATTLRQIYENNKQAGNVEGSNKKGGYETVNAYAKPTNKQTTSNTFKLGNANGINGVVKSDGRAGNYYAKPTVKQTTINTYYNGAADSNAKSNAVYDPYYKMEINDRKEILADRYRKLMNSSQDLGYDYSFTGVKLKDMDNTARSPAQNGSNKNQYVSLGKLTKNPTFVEENTRIDDSLFNILDENPYNHNISTYFQ